MDNDLPKEYIYGERECPYCGKPIYDTDSLRCIYCERKLPAGDAGLLSKINTPRGRLFAVVVALLLVASFLLWLIL